ncbi:MAG: aldo/keto reductase [Armatimonadetes bacterium]|nr:aldo/keto reductase [Armatimonadota bacterium]
MTVTSLFSPALNREVSRLGMGTMIFSPARPELVCELLAAFLALGGNLIDSAQVYGGSEAAIGMWLAHRGRRDDVILLDKGCHPPVRITPETIRQAVSAHLEKMGTDYIDIWMMHRDDLDAPIESIVDTCNEEIANGRIRSYGGSNFSLARLKATNEYAARHGLRGMDFSSPNLCLAIPKEPFWAGCTHATQEDIAWHRETGVPLIAWSSQGRGFFREESGPENASNPDLVRVYHNEENFERLARAREMARRKNVTVTQIALAYVLNVPAPTIALVGPENVSEVESCVRATHINLSEAEMDWLTLRRDERPW